MLFTCLCLSLTSGAGQDVGRSCILVSIAGKNVMLDCGMHMGYNDDVSMAGRQILCVDYLRFICPASSNIVSCSVGA